MVTKFANIHRYSYLIFYHTSILSNPFPILIFSSSNQTLAHNSRKSFCTYPFIKPKRSVTSHITKLFLLFVRSRVYPDIILSPKERNRREKEKDRISINRYAHLPTNNHPRILDKIQSTVNTLLKSANLSPFPRGVYSISRERSGRQRRMRGEMRRRCENDLVTSRRHRKANTISDLWDLGRPLLSVHERVSLRSAWERRRRRRR